VKHLKKYYLFESWDRRSLSYGRPSWKNSRDKSGDLNENQVRWLNECSTKEWEYDSVNGLVNIEGSFDCSVPRFNTGYLTDFYDVKFGTVSENFNCSNNKITSLEGSPLAVGGNFNCSDNKITSLEGSPKYVGGDLDCSNNNILSLNGIEGQQWGGFIFNNGYKNEVKSESLIKIYELMKESGDYYFPTLMKYGNYINDKDLKILIANSNLEENISYFGLNPISYNVISIIRKNHGYIYNKIKDILPNTETSADLGDLGF
jgi:hypothetical protein